MSVVKKKFWSAYNRPKTVSQRFDFGYKYQYVDEASKKVVDAYVDQDAQMQSATFISPQQFVESGMPLFADDENYGDFTDMPQSYEELLAYAKDVSDMNDSLIEMLKKVKGESENVQDEETSESTQGVVQDAQADVTP